MKLRDILKTEKDWTKEAYARDGEGAPLDWDDDVATCCRCLLGACLYVEEVVPYHIARHIPDKREPIIEAIKKLFPERLSNPNLAQIPQFNDHPETTFDDICKVIELAGV